MTAPLPPLPLGDLTTFVRRVYGASPLRGDGEILAVRFDADGLLWSLEEPGVLRQWDLAIPEELSALPLDELATLWQFDPLGRYLAGASDEVVLWDLETGDEVVRVPAVLDSVVVPSRRGGKQIDDPIWVTAVAFHPTADRLAVGHDDGVVRLWDIDTGDEAGTLGTFGSAVSAVAFDPAGTRLAVAHEDRLIRVWDVAEGRLVGQLEGHTDRVPALAWHPDGRRVLSAGWDTTVRVWDADTFQPVILLNAHQGQVLAFAVSPDGRLLASADAANAVHLWDLDAYRERGVLRDRCAAEVRAVAFSPDGGQVVFGGVERTLNPWDVTRPHQDANPAGDGLLHRTAIGLRDGGRQVVSLGHGTGVRRFDAATGDAAEWPDARPLRALAVSRCGRHLAGSVAVAGAKTPTPLVLWDAATGTELARADEPGQPITTLAFSPAGDRLATASYQSSNVWLWSVPGLEPLLLANNAVEGLAVQGVAFHPAGDLLAVAGIDHLATSGGDGRVEIYDPRLARTVVTLPGGASVVAFTPDGRHLVVATLRLTLRVIDWPTVSVVHEWTGPTDTVNAVVFSPEAGLLAVGGDDRAVRLYDAATFAPRAALELDEQVKALAFSPDGRLLYTGNGNGTAYRLDVGQVLADAGV